MKKALKRAAERGQEDLIKEILFELKRKGLWGFVTGKKIRRTGGRGMVTQIIQILCHFLTCHVFFVSAKHLLLCKILICLFNSRISTTRTLLPLILCKTWLTYSLQYLADSRSSVTFSIEFLLLLKLPAAGLT